MSTTTHPPLSAALESTARSAAKGEAMASKDKKAVSDRELLIMRVFDAPRELVFEAWTKPEHLMKWWGPAEYPASSITADVRPGGRWRHSLRSVDDGSMLWHEGEFREVVPPERLVFTFAWDGDNETIVTVTFENQGGKTLMTFHQAPFDSVTTRDSHIEGWKSCFDRLEGHLSP
jgi:uncharacterized protein YndB with AHSA1/START domain